MTKAAVVKPEQKFCSLCGTEMTATGTDFGDWSQDQPNTRLVKTYRQCPHYGDVVPTYSGGFMSFSLYYTSEPPKSKKRRDHDRVLVSQEYVDQTQSDLAKANATIKTLRADNAKLSKKIAKATRALGGETY